MLLQDQTAIITGGAQGIGLATAQIFAANGANIIIGDLDDGAGEMAVKELVAEGHQAHFVRCDVTEPTQVDELVHTAVDRFGALDVMVNNAGITRDATMRKMTVKDFDDVVSVHLKGCWLGTRAASIRMREQGTGSIVNLSSISGKVGNVGQTNYSAAKAGIVGLTKAAAKELGYLGIRVNAIQPGLIRTAMTEKMPAHIYAQREQEIPLQRAGEPEEIAKVALFLGSDLSSYMTGSVLEVTGGRHL